MGTRTPTQVKNYFYDSKKTIAKQKDNRAKIAKGCAKSATGLKKTKRGKKEKVIYKKEKEKKKNNKGETNEFVIRMSRSNSIISVSRYLFIDKIRTRFYNFA